MGRGGGKEDIENGPGRQRHSLSLWSMMERRSRRTVAQEGGDEQKDDQTAAAKRPGSGQVRRLTVASILELTKTRPFATEHHERPPERKRKRQKSAPESAAGW